MKHVGTAGGLLRQICADMPEVLRLDDNDESEVQGNNCVWQCVYLAQCQRISRRSFDPF